METSRKIEKVRMSDGIIKQNVVLMSGLFTAPVIGAAYNFDNSLAICASFSLITLVSIAICSFIPRKLVFALRIVLYSLISAAVYVPVMLLLGLLFSENVIASLGVYLPILIINPLILSKAESRFYLRPFRYMIKDAVSFIIGFDAACLLVGIIRDLLINNAVGTWVVNLPFTVPALEKTFGGFIIVGILAGLFRAIYNKVKNSSEQ